MDKDLRSRIANSALRMTTPLRMYIKSSPVISEQRRERMIRAAELLHDAVLGTVEAEEREEHAHNAMEDARIQEGFRRMVEHSKTCPVLHAHCRSLPPSKRLKMDRFLAALFAPPI
jgi:hypothetical protein